MKKIELLEPKKYNTTSVFQSLGLEMEQILNKWWEEIFENFSLVVKTETKTIDKNNNKPKDIFLVKSVHGYGIFIENELSAYFTENADIAYNFYIKMVNQYNEENTQE